MHSSSEIKVSLISGHTGVWTYFIVFMSKKTALENLSKRFRYTLYRGRTTSTTFNTFLLYRPLTISVRTDCRHSRTHTHIHTHTNTHGRARWAYIESCATSINFTAVVVLLFCEWLCMWNTSVMIYGGNNFATRNFFFFCYDGNHVCCLE